MAPHIRSHRAPKKNENVSVCRSLIGVSCFVRLFRSMNLLALTKCCPKLRQMDSTNTRVASVTQTCDKLATVVGRNKLTKLATLDEIWEFETKFARVTYR